MSAAGRGRLVAALTIGGALAFLFWPLLVGWAEGTPRWFEWDVPEQYWPDLVYLCEALHDGELPRWNPYDRAGYPFYADPQAGTHHPLNWAICAVAGPSPGVGWAHLRVVLGFAFAGLFGVLWLRRLELAWSGAIVGGVALMAAPFMRHNWELNLTSALGWMPLMLWAAEGVVRRRRVADGVALAFAAASCAWVGSPPALWQASTLTLLYGLGRAAMVLRAEDGRAEGSRAERVGLGAGRSAGAPDAARELDDARARGSRAEGGAAKLRDDRDEGAARRARRRALGGMAKAAGVAALLGAAWIGVVFVPGLELAEHSVQAGRSYEAIADKGLGAEALEALIAPRSGNHLYGGWLALAALAVALWRRRGLALLGLGLAALAVGMAMGDHGPVFRAAFDHVPGVALFRLPHRYEAWLGPSYALFLACALDALAGWRPARALVRLAPALALAAGLLAAAPLPFGLALGPSALLAGAALLLVAARFRRVRHPLVGAALAALLLADVSAAMPAERHTRGGPHPGRAEVAARVLPRAPGTADEWRYMDEFGVSCRSGTRHRRRDLRGYQDPLLLKSYERVLARLHEHPGLALQYNTRYALQGPHFIHGWNRHFLPPPGELARALETRARGEGVLELVDALPFAYWVPTAASARVPDRQAALRRLEEEAPTPVALLDRGADAAPTGEGVPSRRVAATAVRLERDRLAFRIDAPAPGWVVVNEAWYPGWEATVDGAPTPIARANALVRALPIDAGPHRVTMRFAPSDARRWRLIWLAAWLAFLAWAAASLWRRRRPRAP